MIDAPADGTPWAVMPLSCALIVSSLLAGEPSEPELDAETARQMMVAGTTLTVLSTWSIGMLSARLRDSPWASDRELGRYVPIPFAGPIIYAATEEGFRPPLGTMLALAQGSGLAFLTLGAVSMARRRRLAVRRSPVDTTVGQLALAEGLAAFATAYGLTFGFTAQRAREGDEFSRRLQAPVIGGFWAASRAPNYTRGYLGLTTSAVQLVSVSAVVFGVVVLSRKRSARRVSVMPVPTADGVRLVAGSRF